MKRNMMKRNMMKRNMAIVAVFSTVLFASCENAFINSILPDRTEEISYTVTFDKNHGDADGWKEAYPKTVTVVPPKTTVGTLPTEPERTGWKFTGWNTDRNGNGTPFTASTQVKGSVTVYAQWEENKVFTVDLNISGKAEGDSVALSPSSGEVGSTVTITYTVTDSKFNNQLAFTGTTVDIDQVSSAGIGTRTYMINEADATDGSITIDAVFTHNDDFTVALNISGNVSGDSVDLSPRTGEPGDTVTINYTVGDSKHNNLLVFSGTTVVIDRVNSAESGTRTYTINGSDAAANRIITINAEFTHTDKEIDTIAFEDTHGVGKVYGEGPFTKAITNTGAGTGAISYSSGTPAVATVDSATGEVTILSVGSSTITATKATDETYAAAEAKYILTVSELQLTISDPAVTTTKTYNGNTTAAFTIGTLINKLDKDTVNVTAAATYNSENVATANLITVVYTITGAAATNYIKPVNYPIAGTITRADGAALATAPTATATSLRTSSGSITVTPVTPPANGQTVEYAISTTEDTPSTGWQPGISFPNLAPQSEHYIFARAEANANYNAGAVRSSEKITIPVFDPDRATIIDFENDAVGKTYSSTQGNNSPSVAVASDPNPAHNGQKSLQIATNPGGGTSGYNQAAIIPIHLPYELQNYKSFSFRFYLVSGTSNVDRQIMVYAAENTSTFVRYAFGNPSDHSNPSQQFAANLVGQTPNVSFSSTGVWIDYTIPINDPGQTIKTLQGDIFIAIGINNDTVLNYYVDDLTFTLTNDFVRPPALSPATATFDKKDGAQADITVTMTPNGHTFEYIQNGTTPLEDDDYTLTDNTVTLKKEYLATLSTGRKILTFVFATAEVPLTVNVIDSGVEVIAFDFRTLTSVTTESVGSSISATITGGALRVVKALSSHSSEGIVLTFNLGSRTLGSFTGVKLIYRGVDGDTGWKDFIIEVPNTAGGTFNALGSNTRVAMQQVNGTTETTYNKINFAGTAPLTRTGELKILFGIAGNKVTYDVILIELVP